MSQIYSYLVKLAKENDTESVEILHTMAPKTEERAIRKIKESSEMLQEINIIPTVNTEGTTGMIAAAGPFTSRTDTKYNPRVCYDLMPVGNPYECHQTNFDTQIRFDTLDAWTRLGDIGDYLESVIAEQEGLEQIMIGFNGTHVANDTDRTTYPLLQDVNIGWLQHIRDNAPDQVINSATVGSAGQYATLDALAFAALQKLDAPTRKRPGLVVLIDRGTLYSKLLANVQAGGNNAEQLALQHLLASNRLAGLPVYDAPYMPDATMLITSLDNLSIYYQTAGLRQFIKETPRADALQFFRQRREAYAVEDYGRTVLIEGIQLLEPEEDKEQDNG